MIKIFALVALLFVGSPVESRASAWIGCDACYTGGMQISPSCSMCNQSPMPTVPTWGMPQLPYCPTCAMNRQVGLWENPMTNWWQPYAPNYWNFYMPGPYNGWGMMPQYFPQTPYQPQGGQGVYFDKPVVYVRGPSGTKIEIDLVPAKGEVLVTVPTQKNWKAEIDGTKLKTSEGNYEFFFYDGWADHNGLQDEKGFCGDRKEALSFMETSLQQMEFPKEAIADFKATWAIKLPHQQDLCVFPQTQEQLKSALELKFKPVNVQLTQLEFIVVPKKFFGMEEAKKWSRFGKAPKSEFTFRKIASVAAEDKISIRAFDWGVGFLRADK